MNTLSEEQRRDPAISAYYGICLAAAKDSGPARFSRPGKARRSCQKKGFDRPGSGAPRAVSAMLKSPGLHGGSTG
jgi:hypothetical protein